MARSALFSGRSGVSPSIPGAHPQCFQSSLCIPWSRGREGWGAGRLRGQVVLRLISAAGAERAAHDRLVPDLDVVQISGAAAESASQGLHRHKRIRSGTTAVDPISGLDHVCPLFCGDGFVLDFLLYRGWHPYFLFVRDFLLGHN